MQTLHIKSDTLVKLIDDQTVAQVLAMRKKDIFPHLALISVGPKTESLFIKLKKKRAKSLGIVFSVYHLDEQSTFEQVAEIIEFLNKDQDIHGIILQLPLPASWKIKDVEKLAAKIAPKKDVDGFNYSSHKTIKPTTAEAIIKLATEHKIDLHGATIVGKGKLVGNPLRILLQEQGKKIHSTDKQDAEMNKKIFKANVIVSGTNSKNPFLDDKFVKENAIIIAAGNEINHAKLEGYAKAMTPKKGGVGPLTISLLMRNVVKSALDER